jgi:hypothetical protein
MLANVSASTVVKNGLGAYMFAHEQAGDKSQDHAVLALLNAPSAYIHLGGVDGFRILIRCIATSAPVSWNARTLPVIQCD